MNEQLIQKQYKQVVSLLEEKRLNSALFQLESLLYNLDNRLLHKQLEQIQTSYRYMLDYMRQGLKDPGRKKLYRQLLATAWNVADQTRVNLLEEVSTHYYYELRRNSSNLPAKHDIASLQKTLEGFPDEMAVCQLTPGKQGLNEILRRHEETHQLMFLTTWSNSSWTEEGALQAQSMLQSETLPTNDLCLFTSAIMLSLMECFDESKINWLLDAIRHSNPQVSQRALVGLIFILHIYSTRIILYPQLSARISLYGEEPEFRKQLNRIYIQLLRSQETEKIDKKMREEIIPEMMRNVNIMRNMKFGFEETDENDFNPDWEKTFEQSGLGDKIREMNELQMEGADVYMSTFAQLKSYPFFQEPHNWFYPFDLHHSSIVHLMGLTPTNSESILSVILQSGFFCNSDKYSFCFTMAQLPQNQREMMLSQMTPDQQEFMDEQNTAEMKNFATRPDVISNQYIHDLYRFFKLSQRRAEFRNVFKEELALHRNPIFKEMLNTPEYLLAVAEFHFRKDHPTEALEIYQLLINSKNADADIFQKTGYCLQKEKRYQEAINAYLKADMIKPDQLWTLRHLATCYRLIKDYNSALEYYHRVEEIQPDNHNVLFHTGSCLAELERFNDALQYFFKLDYLEENCIKAWRGIGWCSFVNGKHEQAMKYYNKILADKPLATDYLNAGHTAWSLGNITQAAELYGKAIAESGSRELFMETFNKDRNNLIKQGIDEEDIPLMLDLIE